MKKTLSVILALCLSLSCSVFAFGADYEFESPAPGDVFYQSTGLDMDHIADSPDTTVGMDGTIGNDFASLELSSSPFSAIDIAVGDYPTAYGEQTDIAIAMNSYALNELGPTTQTISIYQPQYQVVSVASGALPTPNQQVGMYSYVNGVNYVAGAGVNEAGYPFGTVITTEAAKYKGNSIGKVSIGSVGISAYVYAGETWENMLKGAAHFDCTPVWGGNVALAGHNRGRNCAFFATLKDVSYGDVITYETAYGVKNYRVVEKKEVSTYDTSGLLQDGTEKITLYTCKANHPEVKICVVGSLVY